MLHGPLLGKILAFAVPLALTSVLQQLFNSADSAVAGQFVSAEALAGIGATSPLVNLLISLFVGLSVGANVVVASNIALGNEGKLRDAVHTCMAVSLISGVLLIFIGYFVAEPALRAISTPDNVIGYGTLYLQIYFVGAPFMMLYNFGSAVLRSQGDTRRPLYALAIGCGLNLVLDLLFVRVFGWGVPGIAVATVIANGFSGLLIVWFLMHEDGPLRLELRKLSIMREPLMVILKVGVPAGIQGAVFALSNLVIQGAINGFGAQAIAGSTAGINYESYTYFATTAFAQAAVTFTSQNYAARNMQRCTRIWAITMASCAIIVLAVSLLFVGFGELFLGVFTTDAVAISYGMIRMWNVQILEFIPSTFEVSAGCLRGMQRSTLPAIITIIGTCVLRILWVYFVFPITGTYETLVHIFPISWTVTGVCMLIAYGLVRRQIAGKEKTIADKTQASAAKLEERVKDE